VQRLGRGTDRGPLPARKLVDDYMQFAQTCQDSASGSVDARGPKSPDFHRVVWGPHLTASGLPVGFPPVSRLPAGIFPFVRLPRVSPSSSVLRLVPFGLPRFRFPFGFSPGSLSLGQYSR